MERVSIQDEFMLEFERVLTAHDGLSLDNEQERKQLLTALMVMVQDIGSRHANLNNALATELDEHQITRYGLNHD